MFVLSKKLILFLRVINIQKWLGLLVGLVFFLFFTISDPGLGMPSAAWKCLGLVLLMGTWWATQAVPLAVTALLPIIFIPLLGLGSMKAATAPYANPTIFLFLGGFLLGLAMEKCNLHRRIALIILDRVGSSPRRQIGGFMLATGAISMWVSNTATAIMMLPIGMSVASVLTKDQDPEETRRFSCALMLAIAYASSIGGIGTLIGTPPNALLRAFLADQYNVEIGFAQWMLLGVPISLALGYFTWRWLTRKPFQLKDSAVHDHIHQELLDLGPLSRAERLTAFIFGSAAVCWALQPVIARVLPYVDDTFVAMFFGLSLFVVPMSLEKHEFLMTWNQARKLPWGILVLFGGGLSLAGSINASGLAAWLAKMLVSVQGIHFVLMVFILVIVVQVMTEFTSNTATVAAFLPLVGVLALALGKEPALYAIPAALAASCAFMLPVSTPPNAIVFQSGVLKVSDMLRAGCVLTLASGVVITLFASLLVPLIFL